MIGRRAIVGLSLLSALLFCAIAAQGASAAAHTSNNTTAYTCVKIIATGFFEDAHCDKTHPTLHGDFEHSLVPAGSTTIEGTNAKTKNSTTESTPAVLKGTLLKAAAEITCTTVKVTTEEGGKKSTIKNTGAGTEHKVEGTVIIDFETCTVNKPLKCTVKTPIIVKAEFMGVDGLNGAEKNMGLEFTGDGSTTFTEITFEGAECALKGLTFPVQGSAIATGAPAPNARESGATLNFSPEKEMQSLTLGGNKAELTGALTTRMHTTDGTGNPIAFTTTT